MNTHLYKTIFNHMPSSLSIKESEELTENIMGAIQKVQQKELREWLDKFHYDESGNSYEIMGDEFLQLEKFLLQYQSVPVSEWISVENKFPDSGECVLLYSIKSGVVEGAYLESKGHYEQWRWDAIMTDVTHWMPLPKKPL